tara:strand:- start:40314 stop:41399 length:1086 start_codon:yes stop_codon:yes gene_type:complete
VSYLPVNKFRINKGILSIFLLFLVASCGKIDDVNEATYEATKQLHPNVVEVQDTELLVPSGLDVLESGLLVIESNLDSGKFKFFNLDEYQMMESFGVSGRGPDEYSEMIQHPVSTTFTGNTQLYDWVKKRIQVFTTSVSDDGKMVYSKSDEYILPPELMLSQYSAFINDTTVVSSGGLSNGYISFTNVNTDQTTYFNPLKYDLSEYEYREKSYLFESFFGVNNEKELIAVASKYMPELHIVNFEGEMVAKTDLPSDVELGKLQDIENMEANFYGVTASANYVYASYVGKSLNEMDEVIDNNEFQDVDLIKLYKFDWEGNLVDSFILTGGLYRYLSVDEDNNRLYSINSISPNPEVVYFEMK